MKISQAADDEGILEIGPGIGVLTAALAQDAKKVVAVEIDRDLMPVLDETLAGFSDIEVVNADFMKLDIKRFMREKFEGMGVSVAANLPYYITTPIIMKLLEERLDLNKIVIMIQKEVADRILALPGSKDYGALTVAVNFYCAASLVCNVGRANFTPPPKVDSSVIKLEIYREPPVFVHDEKLFFRLVKSAFAQRRKTLANALKNAGTFGGRDEILNAFAAVGIGDMERGENFSTKEFAALANVFYKYRK